MGRVSFLPPAAVVSYFLTFCGWWYLYCPVMQRYLREHFNNAMHFLSNEELKQARGNFPGCFGSFFAETGWVG